MFMRKVFLFLAMALLAGCSQDELLTVKDQSPSLQGDVLIAAAKSTILDAEGWDGGADFRAAVNHFGPGSGYDVLWELDDQIVFQKVSSSAFDGSPHVFNLVERGDGEKVSDFGIFTNNDPLATHPFIAGDYIAYYSVNAEVDGDAIVLELPASQTTTNCEYENFKEWSFMYGVNKLSDTSDPKLISFDALQAAWAFVGQEIGAEESDFDVPIEFKHAVAFLEFNISGLPENIVVRQIEVKGLSTSGTNDDFFRKTIRLTADGDLEYEDHADNMLLWIGEGGYKVKADGVCNVWLIVASDVEPIHGFDIFIRTTTGSYSIEKSGYSGSVLADGFAAGTRYRFTFSAADCTWEEGAEAWDCGDPSRPPYEKDDEIFIYDMAELMWVAEQCNTGNDFTDKVIYLKNAMDLSAIDCWEPIGNSISTPFNGTFIAAGCPITGMSDALFGWNTGTIQDVVIIGAEIDGTDDNIGLIAKVNGAGALIENCQLTECKITANDIVGGIVGTNSGTIKACVHNGTAKLHNIITGNSDVGGIAGFVTGNGEISNCTVNFTEINSNAANTGGIAGRSDGAVAAAQSIIKGCISHAVQVTGNGFVGGIVGHNRGLVDDCTLRNQQTLIKSTSNNTGGIAGYNQGNWNAAGSGAQKGEITNCTVNQNIQITGTGAVGGVVGSNAQGYITGCTVGGANTLIKGASANNQGLGGIVGTNAGNNTYYKRGLIENCRVNAGTIEATNTDNPAVATAIQRGLGGIVGDNNNGRILACRNAGLTIKGTYQMAGGIVGRNRGTSEVAVCYFTEGVFEMGHATRKMIIGGIVGRQVDNAITISCVSWFNEDLIAVTPSESAAIIEADKIGSIIGEDVISGILYQSGASGASVVNPASAATSYCIATAPEVASYVFDEIKHTNGNPLTPTQLTAALNAFISSSYFADVTNPGSALNLLNIPTIGWRYVDKTKPTNTDNFWEWTYSPNAGNWINIYNYRKK